MSLTNDRNTPYRKTELVPVPVASGVKIYAGALVVVNAAGFAAPGTAAATLTYLGRAEERVDNSNGVNGGAIVMVRRNCAFKWSNHISDVVTQADFGKTCYVVDDQTVAKTSAGGTRSPAGRVLGLDLDGVWVE
jgi:hypothetical protein